ncbi:MAG: SWIM zinc finger family protein [Polyangiaceae bacterium]
MRRRHNTSWYPSAPKKPPPERGIRIKKIGTTWWGQRWVEALEGVLSGDSGRLARGRTYARAGRTHDLVVKGGKITAKVTGSRAAPYKIIIEVTSLDESVWKQAIANMAEKAQFSAELLVGQMPLAIDDAFRATGTSLFPVRRADLKTSCSCPDWGDPCKHVAAAHYVLGEALNRDPFLLFELRGKTKASVLEALRAARSLAEPVAATAAPEIALATAALPKAATSKAALPKAALPKAATSKAATSKAATSKAAIPTGKGKTKQPNAPVNHDVPTVTLGELKATEYDKPREALPALQFSFEQPVRHGAVLRQLGAPAAWQGEASPADLLEPLVRAAAETARRIAMADSTDAPEVAISMPKRKRSVRKDAGKGRSID